MAVSHTAAEVLIAIAVVLALYFYFPRAQTGVAPTPAAPVGRPIYQPVSLGVIVLIVIVLWLL